MEINFSWFPIESSILYIDLFYLIIITHSGHLYNAAQVLETYANLVTKVVVVLCFFHRQNNSYALT